MISRLLFRTVLLIVVSCVTVTAFGYECEICRSPYRYITLNSKEVDTGGDVFSCQELSDFATNGEFGPQSCAIAQQWADAECGCAGAPITPPPIISTDACVICDDYYQVVGFPNKVVSTSMGDWACNELYHFGFDGFFPPTICNILKMEASQACGCRDAYPSPAPSESPQPTADIPVPTVPTIAPAPPTTEAPIFSAAAPQVPVEAPSNRAGPESKCNLSLSQGRGGGGGTGTAKGCD